MPQPAASSQGPAVAVYRGVLARLKAHWEVWPAVAFALALVLIYLFTAPVVGLPFDDSYISLQFARNLADHGFLTFDGETASSGATSRWFDSVTLMRRPRTGPSASVDP